MFRRYCRITLKLDTMSDQILEQQIETEIREMIQTRYNVVTGLTEYSMDEGVTYSSITDRMEKTILRKLRGNGHRIGVNTVRNILQSDFSNPFNPFEEYFNGLTEWDKTTDYIKALCDVVEVENDTYFTEWMTKWFVAIVASCLDEGVVNHQIPVFSGSQGIGKTTFFVKLVPGQLVNYFATGYMNPESKDAQIQASECFLVNMDEMSSLNPKSMEAFKQLVTQLRIRIRRPYASNPENLLRRASFCGSTNEEQFLHDLTGNRRFLCFRTLDINLEALSEMNIDNVYEQAVSLYKSGFKYWFDKKDNELIEKNNDDFVVKTMEEELILSRFEPCGKDEKSPLIFRMTATDVMSILANDRLIPSSMKSTQRVGQALVKLGFERYKSNGKMLYCVKVK